MSQSLKVLSNMFQASQNWTYIQALLGRRDNCFLSSICQFYLSFTPGEGLHGKIYIYAVPSRSLMKFNWEKTVGKKKVIPSYTRHCVNYKSFHADDEKRIQKCCKRWVSPRRHHSRISTRAAYERPRNSDFHTKHVVFYRLHKNNFLSLLEDEGGNRP